jgi:crotonobetainyl-CoA:carnitine CoA-transferase CaiB-like acyl-CoA transferase
MQERTGIMVNSGRSKALAGLRVLDLTRVRAGPACCRVLADFGADVIKIDVPAGTRSNEGIGGARHGYDMMNLHRNKRSVTLDLKHGAGRDVFLDMVRTSDVVVENFRPDVKQRLGFDYEVLSRINPRIVLASISGFGQTGPYATRPGFDQIAQGMGGLMGVTGFESGPPTRAGTAVADLSSGVFAATGILVALFEREVSGQGQWVQTSLLQAQIALMDFQAARFLVDGDVPERAGNEHPTIVPMGVVETSDGHINLGVGGDGQWLALCEALERPDLAATAQYRRIDDRKTHRVAIWAELRPIFLARTSEEWISLLGQYGVPAGPIYAMDQVFDDPQVRHLGMARTVHDPERGDVQLVALPVDLSRTPAAIASSIPDAGAQTDEVLQEFGYDAARIAELRRTGAFGQEGQR